MSSKSSPLALVTQQFSHVPSAQIERLYREDITFFEICQDYAECIRMRDRYADDSTDRDAQRYERDYEDLIAALEEELQAILMAL